MVAADSGLAARSLTRLSVHLHGKRSSSYTVCQFDVGLNDMLHKDVPATSQTPEDVAGPRPQNMSDDVRLAIGLLSLTVRAQVVVISVLPTQSCCHVEWAETDATAARIANVVFMLAT